MQKHRDDKSVKKCDPSDFSISFKVSSHDFASNIDQKSQDVIFDKQGVSFEYYQFFNLINSLAFKKYIKQVGLKYRADTNSSVFDENTSRDSDGEDEPVTPDTIFKRHLGTGTQPDTNEELDQINDDYRRDMIERGFWSNSRSPTPTADTSNQPKGVTKLPLVPGKRVQSKSDKEIKKRLKKQ